MKNKDCIQEERKDESYSSIEKMKNKDYKHGKRKKLIIQFERKYEEQRLCSTKQKSIEVECKKRKRKITNSLEGVVNIFHKKICICRIL